MAATTQEVAALRTEIQQLREKFQTVVEERVRLLKDTEAVTERLKQSEAALTQLRTEHMTTHGGVPHEDEERMARGGGS